MLSSDLYVGVSFWVFQTWSTVFDTQTSLSLFFLLLQTFLELIQLDHLNYRLHSNSDKFSGRCAISFVKSLLDSNSLNGHYSKSNQNSDAIIIYAILAFFFCFLGCEWCLDSSICQSTYSQCRIMYSFSNTVKRKRGTCHDNRKTALMQDFIMQDLPKTLMLFYSHWYLLRKCKSSYRYAVVFPLIGRESKILPYVPFCVHFGRLFLPKGAGVCAGKKVMHCHVNGSNLHRIVKQSIVTIWASLIAPARFCKTWLICTQLFLKSLRKIHICYWNSFLLPCLLLFIWKPTWICHKRWLCRSVVTNLLWCSADVYDFTFNITRSQAI